MVGKRSWILVAVALVVSAPVVHAAGGWTLGVNGGISKATGDFGKELKVGPAAGIDICMHVNDRFAVGADANWTTNSHKDVGVVESLGGSDTYTLNEDKLTDISGGVHGKYMFPAGEGRVSPFAMLGVGFYRVSENYMETIVLGGTTFINTDESDGLKAETRLGGKGGAGFVFKANEKVGVTVQGEYNIVTLDTAGAPAGTPSTFKFFGVRAGVNYHIMKQ